MNERLEKRLASIQDRIARKEEELKKELAEFSRRVAQYTAWAEDGRLKASAEYITDYARGGIERVRAFREELDKLYAEKYILEWIKGDQ